MIAYALVGAFSAVVQLASVAASAAYVAQISRRRLREKQQSWVSRNQLEIQVNFLILGKGIHENFYIFLTPSLPPQAI